MKVIIVFICSLLGLMPVYGQTKSASVTISEIRKHCRQLLLSDTAYATEQSYRLTEDIRYDTDAAGYFKALSVEGSWNDITYQSQTPSSWLPSWHLYRILLLCRAYYKNNDPAYLAGIHRALRFWIKNDFICKNWWQNNINVPFAYSSIILQLGARAEPDEMDFLNNVIVKRIPVNKATGQNLIWQLDNEARVALIHNDYDGFAKIMTRMQTVIEVTTKEGVQPDYSFHQHGPMLQFGNYGMHFVNSLLFWMTITANTPLAFDKEKQQIIFDYCSKGLRWTIYNRAMDITAVGRQLRGNSGIRRGNNLYDDFNLIRSYDKNYSCNYIMDGFNYPDQQNCTLAGNKSFWSSDYMVQLKKGHYMMSVKMNGPFVKPVESINGENLKGALLNDGVALVQRTGKEHRDIEAIWNWAMLPGTTTDTTINPASRQSFSAVNHSAFVGQVSDGLQGISAMAYNRLNVKANKSYFFVDDMLVALGAGVETPDTKNVVTTVDQRFYTAPYHTGKNKAGQQWLWLDNMAYYFPDHYTQVKTTVRATHGDWFDINNGAGHIPASGKVITTYIAQNKNNTYAYIIKPSISLNAVKAVPGVKILINTPDEQAIAVNNTVMVTFYKAGSITVNGMLLKADKPCLLICNKAGGRFNTIWVADPTRAETNISLTIGNTVKQVTLPSGDYKGSSIKISL